MEEELTEEGGTPETVDISCGSIQAKLVMPKFICPGIHQLCIDLNGRMLTPKAFCVMGDKEKLKDWKNAIRINGKSIRRRMDAGDVDFHRHDVLCTGRCVSRNYGPSKYDVKIARLNKADKAGEEGADGVEWSTFDPFTIGTLEGPAYNILREIHTDQDDTVNVPGVGKVAFPCLVGPEDSLDNVVVKEEPVSDSEQTEIDSALPTADSKSLVSSTSGVPPHVKEKFEELISGSSKRKTNLPQHIISAAEGSPSAPGKRRGPKARVTLEQNKIIQMVAEFPDTETLLEDSELFWRGIIEVGLFDDVIRDVKHSVDNIKNEMVKHSIKQIDCRKLSNVVTELGLITKIKWRLAEHKARTANEEAELNEEIEALKKRVAASEAKQKMLKRKSETFDNFLEKSIPPKRAATTTSRQTRSSKKDKTEEAPESTQSVASAAGSDYDPEAQDSSTDEY